MIIQRCCHIAIEPCDKTEIVDPSVDQSVLFQALTCEDVSDVASKSVVNLQVTFKRIKHGNYFKIVNPINTIQGIA